MTSINKKEQIENLSDSDIIILMKTLLEKRGVKKLKIEDNCILGIQEIFVGSVVVLFINFSQRLGGITDDVIKEIYNDIVNYQKRYGANNVFIFSKQNITNGFKDSLSKLASTMSLSYMGRQDIINLIDSFYEEYWRHDNVELLAYESNFIKMIDDDTELRKLTFPQEVYKRKLNFFIEPQLTLHCEDKATKAIYRKKYSVNEVVEYSSSLLIDGHTGSGKSTLLKQIGKILINANSSSTKKSLPVYCSAYELLGVNFDIQNLLLKKLSIITTEAPLSEITDKYNIHLLIDSIDEFEEKQKEIFTQLNNLESRYHIKYYIASRNAEALIQQASRTDLANFNIRKFNVEQIKHFLNAFFSGDENKTNNLMDALRENKIIERLPITPLNLSLISILFEEKDFEIPATISDIYDNFNSLIIGRAVVSSKVELIDVSFKERILSIYALELLKQQNHIPMTQNEFIEYFKNYYDGKSIPVKRGSIEDVLMYLIHNTGIIFLKDNVYVQFTHASYMEYYAAVEIFKYRRELENELVDNFYDPNWQNAVIFYAGKSKDMPDFLNKILIKVRSASTLQQYFSAILGCGYLIQALYLTDNKLRKDIIIEALHMSLDSINSIKKMAADDVKLYKDFKMPVIYMINFVYFYEIYNSVTLIEPMKMAFEELYVKLENLLLSGQQVQLQNAHGIAYNLLELAFTLDSKRLCSQHELEKVIDNEFIIKDPSLLLLTDFVLSMLGKEKYKELKMGLQKSIRHLAPVHKALLKQPISKLRFTPLDTILPFKKVKLIVEGKTDAIILEHAFLILTEGHFPYWSVKPGGHAKDTGSALEVAKSLEHAYSLISDDELVIGIVDHDAAGLSAFRRLNKDFCEKEKDKWKKHKDGNIHFICLPVPGEMHNYLQKRQEINFFEIEHYFGEDFLKNKGLIKETEIPNIYEFIDSKKTAFANSLKDYTTPDVFVNFMDLFTLIDKIAETEVRYVY